MRLFLNTSLLSPQVANPPYNSNLCGVTALPHYKGGWRTLLKSETLQGGFTTCAQKTLATYCECFNMFCNLSQHSIHIFLHFFIMKAKKVQSHFLQCFLSFFVL
jgi:hypothetical protein